MRSARFSEEKEQNIQLETMQEKTSNTGNYGPMAHRRRKSIWCRAACVTLNYLACYSPMLCICLELKGLDCFHLCSFL